MTSHRTNEGEDPELEALLLEEGRREQGFAGGDCPRTAWVLECLTARSTAELDEDLVEHLGACPACWEIAWVYRETLEERGSSGSAPIPPLVESAVREALGQGRGEHGGTATGRGRRRHWYALLPAALAAGLLLMLGPRVFSRSLIDSAFVRSYALPPEGSERGPRNDRVWLHVNLGASAHVYAGVAYTLGDEWTFEWIETSGDGVRPLDSGPFDLFHDIPEGALTARCVLLAARESLDPADRETVEKLAGEQRFDADAVEAIAGARRGKLWWKPILPEEDDPEPIELLAEVEQVLASSTTEFRTWVQEHPKRAAAAVAQILEKELDPQSPDPSSRGFEQAERIAGECARVHGIDLLVEQVAIYRFWASSPQELEHKRRLDRSIHRNLPFHDQNSAWMWIPGPPEDIGSNVESERFYRQAAEEYARLGDRWGEIESLLRMAFFATEGGEQAFEHVIDMSVERCYPRAEALALNLQAFLFHQGQVGFDQLRIQYEFAWDLLDEIRLWEVYAVARNNFGLELLYRGVGGQAFSDLEEALRIQQALGLESDEAWTLYKLAWAHAQFGRSDAALALAMRAIRILQECEREYPDHFVIKVPLARAHWMAALTALRCGKPDLALRLATDGERITHEFTPDDSNDRARCLNVAARAELALRDPVRAEETAHRAHDADHRADDANHGVLNRGQALTTLGLIQTELGRWEEALESYARARVLFGQDYSVRMDLAELLDAMAELQEDHDRWEEALETRLDWLWTVEEILSFNDVNAVDQAYLRERFRKGLVAGLKLAHRLQSSDPRRACEASLRFLEAARMRPKLESASLAELQSALPLKALWLQYLFGDEGAYLLVASADRARSIELTETRAEIAERLGVLDAAIRAKGSIDSIVRAGQDAFDALLDPALAEIGSHDLLLVAPDPGVDAPLFEVFVDGRTPRGDPNYLILDHTVAYLPSARFLVDSKQMIESPSAMGFLGLSASTQEETRADPDEVGRIARLFEAQGIAATVIHGTEPEFVSDPGAFLERFSYVHCRTHLHGAAVLELPGAPNAEANLLEVTEIAGPPRLSAKLLVLSSVESRRTSSPREWGGLAGAFLAQGARTVVSDLWPVDPERHTALLERFYQEVLANQDKGRALREAKLGALRGGLVTADGTSSQVPTVGDLDSTHPWYWAALVLVGDPR